jgi:hypothetical protein
LVTTGISSTASFSTLRARAISGVARRRLIKFAAALVVGEYWDVGAVDFTPLLAMD